MNSTNAVEQIQQAGQAAQEIKMQLSPWLPAIAIAAAWFGRELNRFAAWAGSAAEKIMTHGGILKIAGKIFWNSGVSLFLIFLFISGCTSTAPSPTPAPAPVPAPKRVLQTPNVSSIAPPAPAITNCNFIRSINGVQYVYKNCQLIGIVTNLGTAPVDSIVLTFYAKDNWHVVLHTGQPIQADYDAVNSTVGFWSIHTTWTLQSSSDAVNWKTLWQTNSPGQRYGVVTLENDFSPQLFFRMGWE